jgi:hypothetical protein
MKLISNHIGSERKKAKPDQGLITQLEKMVANGQVKFENFVDTGRFINEKEFRKNNPKEVLEADCTDIVVYAGKLYLQVLKSGNYCLRIDKSKGKIESQSLDVMERALWSLIADKLFNDKK